MKSIAKIAFIVLSIASHQHLINAMTPERLFEIAEQMRHEADRGRAAIAQAAEHRHQRLGNARGERAVLTTLAHPAAADIRRIAELDNDIANMERIERQENALNDVGIEVVRGVGNWAVGTLNRDNTIAIDTNRIRNEGIVNNQGALQRLRHITQPRTMMWIGAAVITGALGIIGGYYGTKLVYEQIKVRLGVPELVEETSRLGAWQSIAAVFKTKKTEETKPTDEIILSPEIAAIAERIAEDTKETAALHLPYQNLLLYGPPGTGKAAFAKILAMYSGMDYAILSGSRFAQFESEKRITEFFKIVKWAKGNSRGTIIFIDEADACFRDRKTLDQDGINFVNAFLSETGANSDKFMFVFVSNYENELDSAVLSRTHKKINFPLPALPEREKILQQKITKYVVNDKRTFIKNDKEITESLTIADNVTPEYLQTIAKKIDGFSGRDIDYAVSEMRMRSYRSGNNTLTRSIVEMIINEKIAEVAKDKKTTAYQDMKMQRMLSGTVNQASAAA